MATTLTIDELEREILYLREQNQKILQELSKCIEENAALREKLHVQVDSLAEGYEDCGEEGGVSIEQKWSKPRRGFIVIHPSLN